MGSMLEEVQTRYQQHHHSCLLYLASEVIKVISFILIQGMRWHYSIACQKRLLHIYLVHVIIVYYHLLKSVLLILLFAVGFLNMDILDIAGFW